MTDRVDEGRCLNRDFDQSQYSRRREDNRLRPYELVAQQPRRPDNRNERRPTPSKFADYAALVYNLEHIFQVDNRNKIPALRPLRNIGKNLDQFCHYHNSPGHWTSACFVLHDAVEQLVREGALQEFFYQTRGRRTPEQALQHVPNRAQPNGKPNNDKRRVVEPNRVQPQRPQEGEDLLCVIFAIFDGDKPGHTPSQRWVYC